MQNLLAPLAPLAAALHDLGMVLYVGPMVAFTVLIAMHRRLRPMQPWDVVRTYRAWGAGLGLSMGAWVLGLLLGYYIDQGAFVWRFDSPTARWTTARFLVFLALWAWNLRVEVWSLEPLRRLDQDGVVADPGSYAAATARLVRDMALQSVLCLGYVLMASSS